MSLLPAQCHVQNEPAALGRDEIIAKTAAQACFALLDLVSSASVPEWVTHTTYPWQSYFGRFTRTAHCHELPWPCAHLALFCHLEVMLHRDSQDESSHIYPPTYLSIYLPNYLHTVREDLIPIHLSIYYFLLSLFLEKWGERIRTNSTKLTPSRGMGLRRRLCYAIYTGGRSILPRRYSVVFIYLGDLTSTSRYNQHAFAPLV